MLILVSRSGVAKFYDFFYLRRQHKDIKIKPFQTNSNDKHEPTKVQVLHFALKAHRTNLIYIFEIIAVFLVALIFSSCLSMAIQWNSCLDRNNYNYSFNCLNLNKREERTP